jgi:integrase
MRSVDGLSRRSARRVCDLTEEGVRRFVAELSARALSPKRVNFIVPVLRMIVRVAVRRRFLRDDPLVAIRPLREPRADVDPFAPEEITAFLAACPGYWRPYFTVAFWTDVRPGELTALKWGDVDLTGRRLRIRAGRYRGHEGSPKTDSSVRDVDLLPPIVEALLTQRAAQAAARLARGQGLPDPGRDYVFTMPSPSRDNSEDTAEAWPLGGHLTVSSVVRTMITAALDVVLLDVAMTPAP